MLNKYIIPLLFLFLPMYFDTGLGINIPVLVASIMGMFYVAKLKINSRIFIVVIMYFILVFFQYFTKDILSHKYLLFKLTNIIIFISTLEIIRTHFSVKYLKLIKLSFALSIIYAFYAGFSYIGHYDFLLIPGTANSNNISSLGIFRAGTFGEGNYLGTYLLLISILFIDNIKILTIALVSCFICLSPIPIFLISYILLNIHLLPRFIKKKHRIYYNLLFVFLISLIVFLFWSTLKNNILEYTVISDTNQRSSFIERSDFILSGIKIWFEHPILGCGLGQFSEYLSSYSSLPHLVNNYENFRYIANNNLAEILSEQGIVGIIYYFYAIRGINNNYTNRRLFSNTLFLVIAGLTMPTFYQIIIAVFLGIYKSNAYKQYINLKHARQNIR